MSRIGVWKHLDHERIARIAAMEVYGDAGARLDFSAYETGVSELGFILESSLMACELWENVKRQPNLTLLCPASPQRIEFREDAALLGLADGNSVSAKLIVAADGRSLARAVRVAGKVEPVFVEDIAGMPQAVLDIVRDGDVVLTMGAGSIGGVPGKLAQV